MDVVLSASLGILFLVVGCATVFLMYYLWGFPFDHDTHTSAAPPSLMRLHRVLGYIYVVIYVVMMFEMVPRMWSYQVEWPTRTVAHMICGMSLGVVLMIKLMILRWFRHFEEWMPVLGSLLLIFTLMLSALSMPNAFREMVLAGDVAGGDVYGLENRARVAKLLQGAGLPEEADLEELASVEALQRGRVVLLRKCVVCHDIKTILVRPRAPSDWVRTVERMALKPAFGEPISEMEQWQSSAYLVAISRDIQKSARERRQGEIEKVQSQQAMAENTAENAAQAADTAAPTDPKAGSAPIDEKQAQQTYETICAQCHELSEVDKAPPHTADEVAAVIKRMIDDNDLKAEKRELELIEWYMNKKFVAAN